MHNVFEHSLDKCNQYILQTEWSNWSFSFSIKPTWDRVRYSDYIISINPKYRFKYFPKLVKTFKNKTFKLSLTWMSQFNIFGIDKRRMVVTWWISLCLIIYVDLHVWCIQIKFWNRIKEMLIDRFIFKMCRSSLTISDMTERVHMC